MGNYFQGDRDEVGKFSRGDRKEIKLHEKYFQEAMDCEDNEAFETAVSSYEMSILHGSQNPLVYHNLALLYEDGIGCKQDYSKAAKLYEKACHFGSSVSFNNLGLLYENGKGVMQDYKMARKYFEVSMRYGDVNAIGNLARLHQNGYGGPVDEKMSVELFEKAIKLGDVRSMYNLGVFYEEKNELKKAIENYEKAADRDFEKACFALGIIYACSSFKDEKKATHYLLKSANLGYHKAEQLLVYYLMVHFLNFNAARKFLNEFKNISKDRKEALSLCLREGEGWKKYKDSLKNTKLKNYKIIKRLGSKDSDSVSPEYYGSSAAVYLAQYNSEMYAIKIMYNYSDRRNPKIENTFDINDPSQLFHPNILCCLHKFHDSIPSDFPEWTADPSIANQHTEMVIMPYAERNLADILQKRVLSYKECQNIMLSLLNGIEYLNKQWIAHRDLKLDNIFHTKSGVILIADFSEGFKFQNLSMKVKYSQGFNRGGATSYLPPEIMKAKEGNILDYSKSDVFAVGLIAYQLLTKKWPFDSEDPTKYSDHQVKTIPDCPQKIEVFIRNLIQVNAEDRMSASEALMELIVLQKKMEVLEKVGFDSMELFDKGVVIQCGQTEKQDDLDGSDIIHIGNEKGIVTSIDIYVRKLLEIKNPLEGEGKKLAQKIGHEINDKEGFGGMVDICDRVRCKNRVKGAMIERVWDGIGQWLG